MTASSRCHLIDVARLRAELSVEQLRTRAIALGGLVSLFDLDAYLNGLQILDEMEQDVLAIAVNERLDELLERDKVPHRFIGPSEPHLELAINQLIETGTVGLVPLAQRNVNADEVVETLLRLSQNGKHNLRDLTAAFMQHVQRS